MYASGTPSSAITHADTVAVASEVASAEPTPGVEVTPLRSRSANATIGASR